MRERGFTLLEVLVATMLMAVAVVALLSNLTTSTRNASKLTDHDRAALLARHKMDELLTTARLPQMQIIEGRFDPAQVAGMEAGWRARAAVFEAPPGAGPGAQVLERVELAIWFKRGEQPKTFYLEAYRKRWLQPGDPPPMPYVGQPL